MNEIIKQTLLDLKDRQARGEHMKCPRCGRDAMNTNVHRNALSRYADVHVCDECGVAEAMLAIMQNPLPLTRWSCFRDERPRFDFEALPGAIARDQLRKDQIPYLIRLFERWNAEPEPRDAQKTEAPLPPSGLPQSLR